MEEEQMERLIDPKKLEAAKERIEKLEPIRTQLKKQLSHYEKQVNLLAKDVSSLEELSTWYFSPQWLDDYALDEYGHFESKKRGVLSQDELSDLIDQYRELATDLQAVANSILAVTSGTIPEPKPEE